MACMRFAALCLLLLLPLCAQSPQEAPKKEGRPAPKNLKLLKPDEIRPMMGAFRTALGVNCQYCHVQGDFASDENPKKDVARMMISMAHDINGKFSDGKEHVTCYTCHRGKTTPEMAAPPAAPAQ
jgi:hypothetical protein